MNTTAEAKKSIKDDDYKKNYKFASPVTPVFQKPVVLKSPEGPDLDFGSFVRLQSHCDTLVVIFFLGSLPPLFQFLVNFLLLIYMSMSIRRKSILQQGVFSGVELPNACDYL